MSMTRGNAHQYLKKVYLTTKNDSYREALSVALSALRPVSREQVILCKDCRYWQGNNGGYPHPECRWGNDETPDADDYCSFAEKLEDYQRTKTETAPMPDEAVQMVLERMEALKDGKSD